MLESQLWGIKRNESKVKVGENGNRDKEVQLKETGRKAFLGKEHVS